MGQAASSCGWSLPSFLRCIPSIFRWGSAMYLCRNLWSFLNCKRFSTCCPYHSSQNCKRPPSHCFIVVLLFATSHTWVFGGWTVHVVHIALCIPFLPAWGVWMAVSASRCPTHCRGAKVRCWDGGRTLWCPLGQRQRSGGAWQTDQAKEAAKEAGNGPHQSQVAGNPRAPAAGRCAVGCGRRGVLRVQPPAPHSGPSPNPLWLSICRQGLWTVRCTMYYGRG